MESQRDVRSLIGMIQNIPGQKILTLSDEHDDMTIDITPEGEFGYTPQHFAMFVDRLTKATENAGGLIIRQFLSSEIETTNHKGKRVRLPDKNIYGVRLVNGSYIPLPADEVMNAHLTEAVTGNELSPEPGVFYRDFGLLEIEGYLPDEMCEPVYRIIIGEHPAIGQKIGKAHGAYGQTDTVIEGVRAQIFGSQEDGYLVIVKAAVGCQDYGVFTKNQVENLILGDREIERLGLFDSLQTAISYVKSKHNLR